MNKHISLFLHLPNGEAVEQLNELLLVAPSADLASIKDAIAYFRGRFTLGLKLPDFGPYNFPDCSIAMLAASC